MAVGAIIFIAAPRLFLAVFVARITAGVGHSLAYVVLIQHFGETTSNETRGRMGTAIHLFILKGGIISGSAVIKFFSVEGRMDIVRVLGICSLAFTALAIFATFRFFKESPLYLIQRDKNDKAIETLIYLRREESETPEITQNFNECRDILAEDKYTNPKIFTKENKKPMIAVLLLRIAFVLTLNYALKFMHAEITKRSKRGINYAFILNIIHTFCVVFVMFTIDKGRRIHFKLSYDIWNRMLQRNFSIIFLL